MSVRPDTDTETDPERDARLTALYRAGAGEAPPPALDDAIRAAAHRAVASRPRLAGAPFSRAWHVPVSVAAVIVLSASLVMLMREEAPEVVALPRVEAPSAPAGRTGEPAARDRAGAVPKPVLIPESGETGGIGLRPPQAAPTTGLGVRRDAPPAVASGELRQPQSGVGLPAESARVEAPAAFPGSDVNREKNAAAAVEGRARQLARREAARGVRGFEAKPSDAREDAANPPAAAEPAASRPFAPGVTNKAASEMASADSTGREPDRARERAAPAASQAAPVPPRAMAKAAPQNDGEIPAAGLPPEKWLARIEELRRQGRLEDARASLAEFRKRYPEYALPAALRDGIKP